jgi:hypothetical protein
VGFAVDQQEQLGVAETEVDGQRPGGAQVIDRIVGRLQLDHSGGSRTYVLAAPQALSEISGSAVTYTSVSDEDFVVHAVGQGVAEPMARYLVGFFADVRDQQLDETSADLQALLGRAPASLKEGLAELFTPRRGVDRGPAQTAR